MTPPSSPTGLAELSSSDSMRLLLTRIEKLAPTAIPVLILGETGVGKSWLARDLHERSGLKGSFVHVPCPSIPEPLFESELFGHVKGSFTGAEQARAGRLAAARNGTLFLDEIGDMPSPVQAKLLVALEEGEYWPVGSDRPVKSRFRLVSATNRDLPRRVEDGEFRPDLYHRLGAARLVVPPLRHRREDVPALAAAFLESACREHSRECDGFEPAALEALQLHPWPGNVRELRSVITCAVATCTSSRIRHADVSLLLGLQSPTKPAGEPCPSHVQPWHIALAQFEQRYWMAVLAAAGSTKKAAAALAGVSERHLYRKLRQIDLLQLPEPSGHDRSFRRGSQPPSKRGSDHITRDGETEAP